MAVMTPQHVENTVLRCWLTPVTLFIIKDLACLEVIQPSFMQEIQAGIILC